MTIIRSGHGVTERLEKYSSPNICQTRFPQGWTARTAPRNQEQLKEFHRNLHWKGGTKTIYKIPVRTEEHCTSYGHFRKERA